jgi:hypothetical protein
MPRIFNRYRVEQRVAASGAQLEAASRRAVDHLRSSSARIVFEAARVDRGKLEGLVVVRNLAGHKLPTAYPSRRVWLRLVVRDGAGKVFFESGALTPEGAIRGNANDEDGRHFEPHHALIEREDQVQVYESIMLDHRGRVTTGLLAGVRYAKDNRLLPAGFAKASAPADVAVRGVAASDPNFEDGGDRVKVRIPLGGAKGPFSIEAELWYQPIGYRWAENLAAYRAAESARFVAYFRSMKGATAVRLCRAHALVPARERSRSGIVRRERSTVRSREN